MIRCDVMWHKMPSVRGSELSWSYGFLWPLGLQSSSSSNCLSAVSGQPKAIISPACPRSAPGVSSGRDMPQTPPKGGQWVCLLTLIHSNVENRLVTHGASSSKERQGRSLGLQFNSCFCVMYVVHVLLCIINLIWPAWAICMSCSICHFSLNAATAQIINVENYS